MEVTCAGPWGWAMQGKPRAPGARGTAGSSWVVCGILVRPKLQEGAYLRAGGWEGSPGLDQPCVHHASCPPWYGLSPEVAQDQVPSPVAPSSPDSFLHPNHGAVSFPKNTL